MHTIKDTILENLSYEHYVWGGKVARTVHEITGAKESVVERRCRELVEEGKIEVEYEQVEGKGPHCVMYRRKRKVLTGQLF